MRSAKRWPTRESNPSTALFLDFLDPWGNRIEIVSYDNVQFTKAPNVLRGMGLTHLSKNESAIQELTEKGMTPSPQR
jgi:lactoylglutathione lyase